MPNHSILYLTTDDVVQNIGTIKAHGHMKYVLEITGVKLGTHSIVASLASDKVEHVSGEHEVLKRRMVN